jgi:hypothetical protein
MGNRLTAKLDYYATLASSKVEVLGAVFFSSFSHHATIMP